MSFIPVREQSNSTDMLPMKPHVRAKYASGHPRIYAGWGRAVVRHTGTIRLSALATIAAALVVWHSFGSGAGMGFGAAHDIVGYPRIIDGDTIDIAGTRIRLHGIDAPESTQTCVVDATPYRCGDSATLALADLVRGHAVRCEPMGLDRYGRTLGRCRVDDSNVSINSWLVRQGLAVAYRHYSYAYLPEELTARIAGRGLWAGTFQMPWDYRADTRDDAHYRPWRRSF
jgi:endonuclease YncB( thermonuclease family)